jgi:tetratricopeptide (TPR) repeat protein
VLAIEVNGTRLTLTLADASAKLLIGTRDFDIPKKKLAKELGPTVKKFVDDATVDKAKALFAEGNEHYNLGEFDQALDRYKLAYRVKPLPAFQFNIAQCHRKLSQFKEAIAMYQAYLVGVPDAKDKATVESLIAESKKSLADKQALEAQRERDRLATEQKKAEEARKATEAQAAAAAEQSKTEQARIAAERERDKQFNRHPARKWMVLTSIVGLGAIGGGAYFGTQARELQQKFNDLRCPEYPQVSLVSGDIATCDDYREKGKRDALLSNVLIGAGAAVVVTSVIILIADPGNVERPTQSRASVAVTPTSFQVVVKW